MLPNVTPATERPLLSATVDTGLLAGRLIVAALPGPELTGPVARQLEDLAPLGVILFDRNLQSPSQIRELTGAIRETVRHPVLVAIDLEGGRVNRLRHLHPAFAALPPGVEQARFRDSRLVELWRAVGEALVALGFDLDFHPPVDLDDSDGLANGIGNRSLSTDPRVVSQAAAAILEGLGQARVIGCLKHYPGLGGTALDTHVGLATSPLTSEELWQRHVVPYRDLCRQAPMVMTAHAHYPAIDGTDPRPATYSPTLLGEWLRDRIGFQGVIISDDLEMGAVASVDPPATRAIRALDAGCDLVMYCKALDAPLFARDELARCFERGELAHDRLAQGRVRIAELLARFPGARQPAAASIVYEQKLSEIRQLLT